MKKKSYDFVFSLGAVCFCTVVLRNADLQEYSYPFDWLFGSNFLDRVSIIENDFKDWINIEDLELTGTREHPEPCNIYYNKRTDITFNHDFPIGVDVEVSHQKVLEKYERRIGRFLSFLNKSKRILMVYIEEPNSENIVQDKDLIFAQEKLSSKFKNCKIDILYIRNIDTKKPKEIELNKNITKILMNYMPETNDGQHVADLKALHKVLRKYSYKGHRNFDFSISKKGISIVLFKNFATTFRLRLNLFNFEFDFCLGKVRN